jgi:hydroxymethylpyrimidine/phosphomethylpyrimidine kinase
VDALPPEAVVAQMDAVMTDIGVQSAKLGMLLNADIMTAVAAAIARSSVPFWVVDPVMVSRTGAQLIDDAAIATLTESLIPLATILTPNRYEAQMLANLAIQTQADMETAAQRIYGLGAQAVLVKGGGMTGHLRGVDVYYDGEQLLTLTTETVDTPDTHGTGCTLSAAIAANLALGQPPLVAVQHAKAYVTEALQHALRIGQGQGPIGHFYPLLSD